MERRGTLLLLLIFITGWCYGQSTYEDVRSILVANCTQSCHGNNTYSFDISASASTLYDSLLYASPKNPYAVSKNYKLISPGYPDRSYLLRKVANCISRDLALTSTEGAAMPENGPPLANEDIELIRQWILFGAPDTGVVVDRNVINAYYQTGGIPKIGPPTPPKSCEGFQIHMGPILYAPGEESEYYQRYDLNLTDSIEVIGLEVIFNAESHHFILEKYTNNTAQDWPQGLVKQTDDAVFGGDKEFLMAWQDMRPYNLPNGTAFIWDQNESLDLNFHMFNAYNEPMMGEVYVNVYTQPKGQALVEMQSDLVSNFSIVIPNDSLQNVIEYHYPTSNASISNITAHTHKTGTNFDVYLRNSNGTKGAMIYDGTYDYNQGFDTGIFDWHHPPVAFYEPFLDLSQPINNGTVPAGLILEATYQNMGTDTLRFGLTTQEEMMVIFLQYVDSSYTIPVLPPWTAQCTETYTDPCKTDSVPDGVSSISESEIAFNVFPNPAMGMASVEYELDKNGTPVHLEVIGILGGKVAVLANNEQQSLGAHRYALNIADYGPGVYFIRLTINGETSTQKLIIADY